MTSNAIALGDQGKVNKDGYSLHEVLSNIDPEKLDYADWLRVGMAIKYEGGCVNDWDTWSMRDPRRYHKGECEAKWSSFNGSQTPCTMGTLVQLAEAQGWIKPSRKGHDRPVIKRSWNDIVYLDEVDDTPVVDMTVLEDIAVETPGEDWNGRQDLIQYLEALFKPEEYVGYVVSTFEKDGKKCPTSGTYLPAGEIIDKLKKRDIDMALGEYDREVGGWIRFNPLDGQGAKDTNVTSHRYALVESDKMPIERQAAIYDALELPIAALVHSGNKSLHAIVRVDAETLDEYKVRVRFLYDICKKNNLEVDNNNRNPSRLSRMPGLMRNGQKQYLVALNRGKASWAEWKEYIDELNDNLPPLECLADVALDPPPLADELIQGVLRKGHKMLLAGPSKAGKSLMLLELAIAVASGTNWLYWPCKLGRVLYINLELDRASCINRLLRLYDLFKVDKTTMKNIEMWHLRGHAMPLNELVPRLLRRAKSRKYDLIILDPIYKVINGDENAAHQMAAFCNEFDKICQELGAATAYCHHHSKGTQGQKASRDRASGSGVFARDPDALIDLIDLTIPDDIYGQIHAHFTGIGRPIPGRLSAWRLEGTLREFEAFDKRSVYFSYPAHFTDEWGLLKNLKALGENSPRNGEKGQNREEKRSEKERLVEAYNIIKAGDKDADVKVGDVAEIVGVSVETVKKWIRNTSEFVGDKDGRILTKQESQSLELVAAFKKCLDLTGHVKVADLAKDMEVSDDTVRRRIKASERFTHDNGVVLEKPQQ